MSESEKMSITHPISQTFEIKLPQIPAGIVMVSAEKGQMVPVQTCGFMSWEDGERFHDFLDSFASDILRALPIEAGISPENVGSFVSIIRPDSTATVIVKPQAIAQVRTSKSEINAGDVVYEGDILDVQELSFEGVEIPNSAGVLVVLSYRWRRCCFFDFGPLIKDKLPRTINLPKAFGASWRRLMFSRLYGITEPEWEKLFEEKWFPFSGLNPQTNQTVIAAIRGNQRISRHLDKIVADLDSKLEGFEGHWKTKATFAPHLEIFLKASEHYRRGDFVSSLAILIPRIEGLMRSVLPRGAARKQTSFAESVSTGAVTDQMSALFPARFREYLEKVFFADFDPDDPQGVSRNTVSHGVAPISSFDKESAAAGILTLQQIAYCLP